MRQISDNPNIAELIDFYLANYTQPYKLGAFEQRFPIATKIFEDNDHILRDSDITNNVQKFRDVVSELYQPHLERKQKFHLHKISPSLIDVATTIDPRSKHFFVEDRYGDLRFALGQRALQKVIRQITGKKTSSPTEVEQATYQILKSFGIQSSIVSINRIHPDGAYEKTFLLNPKDAELLLAQTALSDVGARLIHDEPEWNFVKPIESDGEITNYCRIPLECTLRMRGVRKLLTQESDLQGSDDETIAKACIRRLVIRGVKDPQVKLKTEPDGRRVLLMSVEHGLALLAPIAAGDVRYRFPNRPHNISDMSTRGFDIYDNSFLADVAGLVYESEDKIRGIAQQWFLPISGNPLEPNEVVVIDGDYDSRGFVIYDPMRKLIHISFAGTNSAKDVWQDIKISMSRDASLYGEAGVHTGVHQQFQALIPQIRKVVDRLLEKYPDASITASGHSLGGALAGTFGLYAYRHGLPLKQLHTFGQLKFTNKAGNRIFKEIEREEYFNYIRMVNEGDPVPKLPPFHKHRNVGQKVTIDRDGHIDDGHGWFSKARDEWVKVFKSWRSYLSLFENKKQDKISKHRLINYVAAIRAVEFMVSEAGKPLPEVPDLVSMAKANWFQTLKHRFERFLYGETDQVDDHSALALTASGKEKIKPELMTNHPGGEMAHHADAEDEDKESLSLLEAYRLYGLKGVDAHKEGVFS